MTDTLARMQQVIGTPSQWTSSGLVLALGEMGLEQAADGTIKAKLGDGTRAFAALPYLGAADIAQAVRGQTGEQLTALPAAASRVDRLQVFDPTSGQPTLSGFTASQVANVIAAGYSGATGPSDAMSYLAAGMPAVSQSVQAKLRLDAPMPEDWGAFGDGASHKLSARFATLAAAQAVFPHAQALTDEIDGTVIQGLLNLGIAFRARRTAATYLTTYGLDWRHGSRFYGAGRWTLTASVDANLSTTTIKYVGAGGANSYVVKISDAAMGTQPSDPNTREMQNITATLFTIDGNDVAEFGLVEVRSWQGNQVDDLTITNCRKCASWAVQCWVTGPARRHLVKNRGAGAWLGRDLFGWGAAGATTVDEVTLIDWYVAFNGCAQTSGAPPFNVFTDTGGAQPTSPNPEAECGLALYGHRELRFLNLQVANNSGPGLYVQPTLKGPIVVDGGYFEFNGKSANASRAWATWINTAADASSWGIVFRDTTFSGTAPAQRLTGTQVTRVEMGPRWEGCTIMGTIVADPTYTNYGLTNCDQTTAFVGGLPATPWFHQGGFQTEPAGPVFRYREGTGTPTFGGLTADGTGWTYSAGNAILAWTRVGRQVFFSGRIALTLKGTGTTGGIVIKGLPFTVRAGAAYNAAVSISQVSSMTTAIVAMDGRCEAGQTRIQLFQRTVASASAVATVLADLGDATSIYFSGNYITSDA